MSSATGSGSDGGRFPILAYPAFVRLWTADAVSTLGLFISTLALQFVMIDQLGADQADIGYVRFASGLPMLLFGLLSGVWLDRMRRRPVLIAANTLAAVCFGTIAAMALSGVLTTAVLAALVFVLGTSTVFYHAAHQSYLPSLVPARLLPRANARVEQTMTVAESVGPLISGVLIRALSAPLALVVSAATRAFAAIVLITGPTPEMPKASPARRHLLRELAQGARWVYRHRMLAPYAIALHVWFFFFSLVTTLYVFYASVDLGLSEIAVGLTIAVGGLTGFLGAGASPRFGERFGVGPAFVMCLWLTPASFLALVFAPPGPAAVVVLGLAYAVNGFGMGLEGPLTLSYRNAVTPDRLRGRMNATIRTGNWSLAAIAGPIAGLVAVSWGNRTTIAIAVAGLVVAAGLVSLSAFRGARMPDDDGPSHVPESPD